HDRQQALLRAAEARVAAAAAAVENLATGSREAELEVIRAGLARAEAELELAETVLARSAQLTAEGTATAARLDHDRAAQRGAAAQLRQLQAQLAVAQLPARPGAQRQAAAELRAAEAEADRVRADPAERRVPPPARWPPPAPPCWHCCRRGRCWSASSSPRRSGRNWRSATASPSPATAAPRGSPPPSTTSPPSRSSRRR